MEADLTLVEALAPLEYPKVVSLPRLLAGRAPGVDWGGDPRGFDMSREAVAAAMDLWADGLRMYAQDILAGAPISEFAWRL